MKPKRAADLREEDQRMWRDATIDAGERISIVVCGIHRANRCLEFSTLLAA